MIEAKQIESEIIDFLQREVFSPEVSLSPDSNLINEGFDSMSLVRLMLHVESTYGLWIPEGEITSETLESVRNLSAVIHRNLNGG